MTPTCRGECVSSTSYSLDAFKDDLAWSLFVLDLGLWLYIFLATLWVVTLFIWSIVLWLAVVALLVLAGTVALCAACGEAASCFSGECCSDACGRDCLFDGVSGTGDCCGCFPATVDSGGGTAVDAFYWGGAYPYDPIWGYYSGVGLEPVSGDGRSCCCCCDSHDGARSVCAPIAWVLYVLPALPENAWGGLCGFLMGTHHLVDPERLYQGGSPMVEFMRMGWRRSTDLHNNDTWRDQVFEFITGQQMEHADHTADLSSEASSSRASSPSQRTLSVGGARILYVDRPFALNGDDNCVPSSYEDYLDNSCWICTQGCDEWDLWLSCRHLFCRSCSTEMLRRRMPCPLCRVASSTVLRGHPLPPKSDRESPNMQQPGRATKLLCHGQKQRLAVGGVAAGVAR